VGIPHDFLPRLFEPFSQAENRGAQRGTGLGLSIVKELLNKMGGKIAVKTQVENRCYDAPHSGTTFTVTIPTPLPSVGHILSDSRINSGTVAVFPQTDLRSQGHTFALEKFGYKVIEISSLADLQVIPEVKYIWVRNFSGLVCFRFNLTNPNLDSHHDPVSTYSRFFIFKFDEQRADYDLCLHRLMQNTCKITFTVLKNFYSNIRGL